MKLNGEFTSHAVCVRARVCVCVREYALARANRILK